MPHSPPGGIAISAVVMTLVKQLALRARSIGTPALKNIETPVEIFVVEADGVLALPLELPPAAPARLPRRALLPWVAALAALAALVVAAAGWQMASKPGASRDKSVAVLPFANMSGEKDSQYFSDGMQDEILTAIAKVRDLKVISRTSTEKFRGKQDDLKAIARALDVATVLEGSVQRAGDKVRINVQLIDANSDAHLWAETYDRDIADVFAVQSEIARKVADALQATLLPQEARALAIIPTRNKQAYDLYLQGLVLERRGPTEWARAAQLYEQAGAADPRFALSYSALATINLLIYSFAVEFTPARLDNAKLAIDRALVLAPELPQAHAALGAWLNYAARDYSGAERELQRARQQLPNDPQVLRQLALLERQQGRTARALQRYDEALKLDPFDDGMWLEKADTLAMVHRYAEADALYAKAESTSPDPATTRIGRAYVRLMWQADSAYVWQVLTNVPAEYADADWKAMWGFQAAWFARDFKAALQAVDGSKASWYKIMWGFEGPPALLAGRVLARMGDKRGATQAFERAATELRAALSRRPDDPPLLATLAETLAGLGRYDEALATLRKAAALLPPEKDAWVGSFILLVLAQTQAAAGQQDAALSGLDQLLKSPAGMVVSPASAAADPDWDPLRKNPRFDRLIQDAEARMK